MDLKGLEDDPAIVKKLTNFHQAIERMDQIVNTALNTATTKDLNLKDRLNHDLFIAYMLNTLFWCYLRAKGLDPNSHKVKDELARVRQYMIKAKEAIERHTMRKTINKPVAERFIKHGIQKRKHNEDNSQRAKKQMRK